GDDGNGNTSTITVYAKESLAANPTQQTARLAFKSWTAAEQRTFLDGLLLEHAYYCALERVRLPEWLDAAIPMVQANYDAGVAHAEERRKQFESGERGELPLLDSSGVVTWDFVADDLGLDDEQLLARSKILERLSAQPLIEVAALEGDYSGDPYWYAIYLRDPTVQEDLVLSVGTIECASGRPTEQAIVAALSRWHPGPEYKVTKMLSGNHECCP
ncbi:MAG: hypothetical protein ACREMY_16055, partial [bacterium]